MGFTDVFQSGNQSQRMRHSILLLIIVATLPCYCFGAFLLGVAPGNDDVVQSSPIPPEFTTATVTSTPTAVTPTVIPSPSQPLQSTPGQFIPPTNTPFRLPTQAPSITPSPTHTPTPTVTVTVTQTQAPNNDPVFNQLPPDISLPAGTTQTVTLDFSDPDGDPVTFSASTSNPNVVAADKTGNTTLDVTGVAQGQAFVTVTLNDGRGGTVQTSFTVTVTAPAASPTATATATATATTSTNSSPVFDTEPTPILVTQGDSTLVILDFSDPDGDTVTFTAQIADPNIATRTLVDATSFTVQGVAVGQTTVTITLSDGNGGTAQRVVNINVSAE